MNHWSVDAEGMQERDPDAFAVWELENAVNFGIRDGKISAVALRKYWDRLDIDPHKKKFLALALSR